MHIKILFLLQLDHPSWKKGCVAYISFVRHNFFLADILILCIHCFCLLHLGVLDFSWSTFFSCFWNYNFSIMNCNSLLKTIDVPFSQTLATIKRYVIYYDINTYGHIGLGDGNCPPNVDSIHFSVFETQRGHHV